jgi:hypothetical protein
MGESALQVNGRSVAAAKIFVPGEGVWFADLDLADDAPLTGAVSITLGGSTLRGTVDDSASGVFGLRRHIRVIGGAAGWRKEIKPTGYTNDAGVRASTVANDAAKACGETLGTFAGGVERLGSHYLRNAGPASRTVEDAARGVPWWVDYAGVTQVSARTVTTPAPESYETISYDPQCHAPRRTRFACMRGWARAAARISLTLCAPSRKALRRSASRGPAGTEW